MIRTLSLALMLARPAPAHEVCAGGCAPEAAWDSFAMLALLSAVGALYVAGIARLWRRVGRGRGVPPWRAGCFGLGFLLLVGAYLSPLHALGDRLFVAHMAEHQLLIVVAAPLLALGSSFGAIAWALPPGCRRGFSAVGRPLAPLARLDVATAAHGLAVWGWHAPAAYGAALAWPAMHWLQHASLFGTALAFWVGVLGRRGRSRPGAAVFCLFATALHTAFLGILLTVAKTPLYPGQSTAAHDWGLGALEDQQLAGLVMWVPGGLAYAAVAVALTGLWVAGSGVASPEPSRHVRVP